MLEFGTTNEADSVAFSPIQSSQATFALTNQTNKNTPDSNLLLPHELRRQRRLEQERVYFKRMTKQIIEQHDGECTIERVHQPSKEKFVERYMKPGKPAILTGMMDSWEGTKSWNFTQLGKRRIWHSELRFRGLNSTEWSLI